MMKDQRKMRSLSTVAALLLLAVFAVGILSVLLGGRGQASRLERRNAVRGEENGEINGLFISGGETWGVRCVSGARCSCKL